MMNTSRILEATLFATLAHQHQVRKDGSGPYIQHPIRVAQRLAKIFEEMADVTDKKYEDAIITALLHDTVEDTDTSLSDIQSQFGYTVSRYVNEVTDDKSLSKDQRKLLQLSNAPKKTYVATLVKLSDKIDNLESFLNRGTPKEWGIERILGYVLWAKKVVLALPSFNNDVCISRLKVTALEVCAQLEEKYGGTEKYDKYIEEMKGEGLAP